MSEEQPPPCGSCNGKGGAIVDTSSNGVRRQTWKNCDTCKGSGNAGGDQ
ncbi:hypothetical protein [Streptomyces phaeochromogenes]|nr:hypothetical protein [Streptomyces phaeochromogenes]WRZ30201.1 hypothetical protein OG931_21850 [Streptomyces phaeochromogenes]